MRQEIRQWPAGQPMQESSTDAEAALIDFAAKWDARYPTISKSWMTHGQRIIPCFVFPADIRKALYTTNAPILCRSADLTTKPFGDRLSA